MTIPKELLKQIINQCSCLVEFIEEHRTSFGLYYSKKCLRHNCHIEIHSAGNNIKDIVTLIHEKIHHEHDKANCKCMKNPRSCILGEYHAYKEGLQQALKIGNKDIIKKTVCLIESQSAIIGYSCHKIAAKKVIRLKLWKKALKLIE